MINDELRAIQSVLNETSRAGNEGAVPATLIVGGQVITGFIVSQASYQRTREAAAADDLTRRVATALNKVDSASPDASRKLLHVYLRSARFVLPDIRLGSSILKLAIEAIDGFMFGIEGDDEGLVLGRTPVLPGTNAAESGPRAKAMSEGSSETSLDPAASSSSATRPMVSLVGAAEPSCPPPEFAEILRKVASAVESGGAFRLMIAGDPVSVPAARELTIEHQGRGESGELLFRLRWS